jgi:hypothetical protein
LVAIRDIGAKPINNEGPAACTAGPSSITFAVRNALYDLAATRRWLSPHRSEVREGGLRAVL